MKKSWWYLIVLALVFLCFFLDRRITDFVISHRNSELIGFFEFFTNLGEWYFLFIVIGIFIFFKIDKRWVVYSWFSLGITLLVVFLLKISFIRERPFGVGPSYSFPSGHASAAFSLVPLFISKFKNYKFLIILIAVLIAFSRIYLGYHYLSDVLAGGLIGYVVGRIISKNESGN